MSKKTTPAAHPSAEEKLDFKKILPVVVIVFVDLLGLSIIIPLLPMYAAAFSASPWLIGILGAVYPLFQFIGAPLLGRLSDQYGRRPILLISQIGTLLGFVVLALANSIWLLFLSRLIDGLSGANISTAQAAISDSTTEKTRTHGLGMIGAAFGLGFIVGPLVAFTALHFSRNNFHVPAVIAALFSLSSILLTWFWLPETLSKEQNDVRKDLRTPFSLQNMLAALRMPQIGLLLVLMFLQQIAFGGFEQMFALFSLNRLGMSASGNAMVFTFVGIILVLVQGWLLGKWSRRFGERKLILAGLALVGIGLLVMAATPRQPMPGYSKAVLEEQLTANRNLQLQNAAFNNDLKIDLPPDIQTGWLGIIVMALAMAPVAVGGGVLHPSINSLITKSADKRQVGGLLGISASLLSLANAAAPVLGGVLFQVFGSSAPFIVGAVLMLGLLPFALRYLRPVPAAV